MIDHTGVIVSDFERSKSFYAAALKPIGYVLIYEFPAAVTSNTDAAGFGEPPKPDFWLGGGTPNKPPIHVAFRVAKRALVDEFYAAAIAAVAGIMVAQVRGHNTIQTTMAHSF